MNTPPRREIKAGRPHPLATALIEHLHSMPHSRILELGPGGGRNTAALIAAGYAVEAVPDDRVGDFATETEFDAALSTHALLHGTPKGVAAILDAVAFALKNGAPFYVTFGSKRDLRYGQGTCVDEDAFAPDSGDEIGVPHVFFDEEKLRSVLERHFVIDVMEETNVDAIVGTWGHEKRPRGSVHWLVRARRR